MSRWLIEPGIGVFLGNPSARVREELWAQIKKGIRSGSATMVWSYPNAQGYRYKMCGCPNRKMEDFEGLALVRLPEKGKKETRSGPDTQ